MSPRRKISDLQDIVLNQPSLMELAVKYHSDKYQRHSYIENFYEDEFRKRRRTVRKLLEIGIGTKDQMAPFVDEYVHGSSLLMWRDYFKQANIYGLDNREDALVSDVRIQSRLCDQSRSEELWQMVEAWGTDWDVVIDDASHIPEHQVISARVIVPRMREGTIYVIEDCREPKVVVQALGQYLLPYRRCDIEAWEYGKTWDDNLVIVRL